MAWITAGLATVVSLVALGLLLPSPARRPRWRVWLARQIERLADRVRGRRPPEPDPFQVLRLQTRLGELAEHIRMLEADEYVYAKAHRLVAGRAAYDDLLEEACLLAGVPVDPARGRGDSHRYADELELASRGWSW